jgi:hypothetical protein
MARQQPSVPPANRSPKGPGSDPKTAVDRKRKAKGEHDGEQENIAQNTRNQGYQQDR